MQHEVHKVPADAKARAHIDNDTYLTMYQESISNPDAFWQEHGQRISWFSPYTKVQNTSFAPGDVSIKWFEDGTLNAP